ncbi:hypothetical protein JOL79_07290 [Microbispora sp. RL4-1S]|uniref:Uncharacterized protein n=1 Tax=Microbispora oryzae TaxID=2806554 RepID=A0A941AIX7_9ACTN|nr:hypothetical protein [Microbispora oryzae]MBP2703603.1 hypothetical protein [Microbispora oryzae]
MAQLVPNPLYVAVQQALRTVEPLVDEIERGIEGPYRDLHTGTVWSGAAAERFDAEFAHHRSRVRQVSDRVLADLRTALARTPPEVTEAEATAIRARYGLP